MLQDSRRELKDAIRSISRYGGRQKTRAEISKEDKKRKQKIKDNSKMKREINNQLKMLKVSIDWWKDESIKTSFEVEEINSEFESGAISEKEVISKLQVLNNKIDYLHRKGVYEQKNLFEFFTTTLK